jgi:hypothetical protein
MRIVVKGDFEGHPFRGNQWTEGFYGSRKPDKTLRHRAVQHGGFTYSVISHKSPNKGKVLSIYPERQEIHSSKLSEDAIEAYRTRNMDLLADPKNYLGGWFNDADGQIYLDVSMIVDSDAEAFDACKKHNQFGYWDLGKKEYVEVNTTQEPIQKEKKSKPTLVFLPKEPTREDYAAFAKALNDAAEAAKKK